MSVVVATRSPASVIILLLLLAPHGSIQTVLVEGRGYQATQELRPSFGSVRTGPALEHQLVGAKITGGLRAAGFTSWIDTHEN